MIQSTGSQDLAAENNVANNVELLPLPVFTLHLMLSCAPVSQFHLVKLRTLTPPPFRAAAAHVAWEQGASHWEPGRHFSLELEANQTIMRVSGHTEGHGRTVSPVRQREGWPPGRKPPGRCRKSPSNGHHTPDFGH